ncbi:MAG TPA: type II CAAX endopeptidase family protein [Polyangia bacterium]
MSLLLAIPLHLFACAAAVAGVFLLRSRLSGPWVGRLQVGSLLLGAAVATVIVSPSLVTETADLQVILSRFAAPELPPTMLVHLLLASFPARALLLGGVLGLQWLAGMAFLIWVGSAFTQRAAAVKEGEREVAPRGVAAGSVRGSVLSRFPSLGAFSRRDSRLLLRDGRRLIQGVSPLLVVAACVVGAMMGGAKGIATSAVAAQFIALGTAMMVILWAGPNILGNERGATWILLILPLDLRRFLARRSFSIGLRGALLAAVVTLSLAHDRGAPAVWRAIAWAAVASALCSPLATSIAVLTFDGKSERPDQARLAAHLWVFFGVGLVLIGTVLMAPLAIKLSTLACLFLFVLGFWQRATHRLPLLLDVDDGWRQRRQPYAGDALVSLLAFLLIQQTVAHLLETDLLFLREILSGLATVVVTTVWLRHRKARVVPLVPAKRAASCLMGAVGGAIALGSVILIHLAARKHWPDLVPFWLGQGARVTDADLWLFSIVAVPVEEFVFRGVIYPALRTSMRVLPSVAISAVIFMVMHQPASAGPALLLGALCAVRVERDGALAGAMITHLIYNLGICAFRM